MIDVGMCGLDLCGFCEHGNEHILWPNSPHRAWAASLLSFLERARAHTHTHTHTHTVVVLLTGVNLVAGAATYTTHNTDKKRTPMPPMGFEPAVPGSERP